MAFLSILSKKKSFGFYFGEELLIDLEVVEGIKHNLVSTITKNNGALGKTSDNIKNEPISIDLVCRISNNPVTITSALSGTISSVLPSNPIAQKLSGGFVNKLSNQLLGTSQDRKQDYFNKLIEMRNNKTPFDIVTGLKIYQNMFFKTLVIDEDRTSENCLIFSCTLEEVPLKVKQVAETDKKQNTGFKKIKEVLSSEGSVLFNTISKFTG